MTTRPWHEHYDHGVPTTMRYPRIPLHDLLLVPVSAFPHKPALHYAGTDITFRQLHDLVRACAAGLAEAGVAQGDRVALHLPNCPQYVIAYYAVLSIGAVVVNVNPMYTAAEIKHVLRNAEVSALVTFDLVLDAVRAAARAVGLGRVVVCGLADFAGTAGGRVSAKIELEDGWRHFVDLVHEARDRRPPHVDVQADAPAMLQYTGGTTGVPKGAVLTHRNLVAAAMQVVAWGEPLAGLDPPERRTVIAAIPYFHVYANTCVLNWSMLTCATQILTPRFDLDEFVDLLSRLDRVSFFPAVPTMIIGLLGHPRAQALDLGYKVRCLNSGAAPLPRDVIRDLHDRGIFLIEGMGLTETSSLAFANPMLGRKKVGSVGVPYIDADVRLVDPDGSGREVGVGEPGEILIKSPLVMREYWRNPGQTADQLRDGWLATGDIAVRDEDWYFFVVDRKKDMIIAGGFNIYPREIDEVLHQHPKVMTAVSVGVPDAYRGETVKAFVVLKPGATATAEEIIAFCRERLAAFKAPKLVEFRHSLPQSTVGKVLRRILREEEATGRDSPA
jgi:long-chain acyl-CoA synthetase